MQRRRITRIKESKERCAKHEATGRHGEEDEKQEESSEAEIVEDDNEMPFENILADQRRKYSSKEEYISLIYNDLIGVFVNKWDGGYLRKIVSEKGSFDKLARNEEEEGTGEASKKNDESSTDGKKSNSEDWKLNAPDEQVEIIFVNENSYRGRISRRKMEDQGVYRWRNGLRYKGDFEDNKIQGKGLLEWQDSGWYEGDFQDGYRHGKGTMVNKNYNLLYTGQWHQGHKHGKGFCRYENGDSYDGDWIMDKREGVGDRIYPSGARYVGDWKNDYRHGIGTMIWSNDNVYRGEWKSGKMHGYGEYTWNGFFNNTLSRRRELSYMGQWHEGTRNGKGEMTLNSIGGARYSGEWRKNNKHGLGTIIGNNGGLTKGDPLFENNILLPVQWMKKLSENDEAKNVDEMKRKQDKNKFIEKPSKIPKARVTTVLQPEQFISLRHYVDPLELTKTIEFAFSCISLIPEKCRLCDDKSCRCLRQNEAPLSPDDKILQSRTSSKVSRSNVDSTVVNSKIFYDKENFIDPTEIGKCEMSEKSTDFQREEYWAYDCISMHMPRIRKVYDVYAKIYSQVPPKCGLVMSRLGLWQLWRDCGIHRKGLSLVNIDNYLAANKCTLMENSPCPFGRIEIWQLIHALLQVSWQLYGKNCENNGTGFPGELANGLHKLLMNDVYPNIGKSNGLLCGPERDLIPLNPVYRLYKYVGKTHSARQLLKTIFTSRAHSLFILRELGMKKFIEIMSVVCPSIKDPESGVIVNMEYELTFLEFFEIFVEAGKELIRMRKMKEETISKRLEERVSIISVKSDETIPSTGGRIKATRSRKKIVANH